MRQRSPDFQIPHGMIRTCISVHSCTLEWWSDITTSAYLQNKVEQAGEVKHLKALNADLVAHMLDQEEELLALRREVRAWTNEHIEMEKEQAEILAGHPYALMHEDA